MDSYLSGALPLAYTLAAAISLPYPLYLGSVGQNRMYAEYIYFLAGKSQIMQLYTVYICTVLGNPCLLCSACFGITKHVLMKHLTALSSFCLHRPLVKALLITRCLNVSLKQIFEGSFVVHAFLAATNSWLVSIHRLMPSLRLSFPIN